MKKHQILPAIILFMLVAVHIAAQPASGTALYVDAYACTTDAVVNHNIGSGDFTFEIWVKPSGLLSAWHGQCVMSYSNGPALYASNAPLSSGDGDGSVGTYLDGSWKNSGSFLTRAIDKWAHIAMVRYHDTLTFYINGIAAPNRFRCTDTIWNSKLLLGGSFISWRQSLRGGMDEARIWNVARTEKELRDYMCRKLSGKEPGLISYYSFNEGRGSIAADAGKAGRNLVGVINWIPSDVPLGDTSTWLYTSVWRGKQLRSASVSRGTLTIDSVTGRPDGIHIYRVDSLPNTHNGISTPTNNGGYYGVFVAEPMNLTITPARYNLQYDYTNYIDARIHEGSIRLYNRNGNADTLWTDFGAVKNPTTHSFKVTDLTDNREALIGEISPLSCLPPESLHADSIKKNSAYINFEGSPADWNIEYGARGFGPGSGTRLMGVSLKPALLDALTPSTFYDVYIQQNCSGASSKWSGPYTFSTLEACPAITSLSAIYLGGDSVRVSIEGNTTWHLEYEASGYTPGKGVAVYNISASSYVVTGLFPNLAYDFYVQDSCSGISFKRTIGPVSIITNCPVPNTINAAYIGTDSALITWDDPAGAAWNLEYGVKGFSPGTGTLVTGITAPEYLVTGLLPATGYDFYIQDTCNGTLSASKWVGPGSLLTAPAPVSVRLPRPISFSIQPNPANQEVTVRLSEGCQEPASLEILSPDGRTIQQITILPGVSVTTIATSGLAPGLYLIRLNNVQLKTTSRLMIAH